MNFVKQIERIHRVDKDIKQRITGNPEEFAMKLGVSRRQLFRMISELKDYGAPIKYSRTLKSFYYCDDNFEMKVSFSLQFVNEQEEKNIFGGCYSKKTLQCYAMARSNNILALTI